MIIVRVRGRGGERSVLCGLEAFLPWRANLAKGFLGQFSYAGPSPSKGICWNLFVCEFSFHWNVCSLSPIRDGASFLSFDVRASLNSS